MATATSFASKPVAGLGSLLAAPFLAVGRFLVHLAETGPRMQALERLSLLSDEDLAARGLTRAGEVQRILGPSAGL